MINDAIKELSSDEVLVRDAAVIKLIELEAQREVERLVHSGDEEVKTRARKIQRILGLVNLASSMKTLWKRHPSLVENMSYEEKINWVEMIGKFIKAKPESLKSAEKKTLVKILLEDKAVMDALLQRSFFPSIDDAAWIYIEVIVENNSSLRAAAANALGRVTPDPKSDKIIIECLIQLLGNKEVNVRSNAMNSLRVYSLRLSGSLLHQAAKALLARIEDENQNIRRNAMFALAAISPMLDTGLDELAKTIIARMENADSSMKSNAIMVLDRIAEKLQGKFLEEASMLFLRYSDDKDSYVCRHAISAMGKIIDKIDSKTLKNFTKILLVKIEEKNRQLNNISFSNLSLAVPKLDKDSLKELWDDLITKVSHKDPKLRTDMTKLLTPLLVHCPDNLLQKTMDILLDNLDSKDSESRLASLDGLIQHVKKINHKDIRKLIKSILSMLKDPNDRYHVLRALESCLLYFNEQELDKAIATLDSVIESETNSNTLKQIDQTLSDLKKRKEELKN